MSDNIEDVLASMNRQYDRGNYADAEMEENNRNDDEEDVVDMNYLLSAGSPDHVNTDDVENGHGQSLGSKQSGHASGGP
jgi:hypothetical protein